MAGGPQGKNPVTPDIWYGLLKQGYAGGLGWAWFDVQEEAGYGLASPWRRVVKHAMQSHWVGLMPEVAAKLANPVYTFRKVDVWRQAATDGDAAADDDDGAVETVAADDASDGGGGWGLPHPDEEAVDASFQAADDDADAPSVQAAVAGAPAASAVASVDGAPAARPAAPAPGAAPRARTLTTSLDAAVRQVRAAVQDAAAAVAVSPTAARDGAPAPREHATAADRAVADGSNGPMTGGGEHGPPARYMVGRRR